MLSSKNALSKILATFNRNEGPKARTGSTSSSASEGSKASEASRAETRRYRTSSRSTCPVCPMSEGEYDACKLDLTLTPGCEPSPVLAIPAPCAFPKGPFVFIAREPRDRTSTSRMQTWQLSEAEMMPREMRPVNRLQPRHKIAWCLSTVWEEEEEEEVADEL